MQKDEIQNEIELIESTFGDLEEKLDPISLKKEIAILEPQTTLPNFWDNNQVAKKVMKDLQVLKDRVEKLENIKESIEDIKTMVLLIEEADEGIEEKTDDRKELVSMIIKTRKTIGTLEIQTYLGGKYDNYDVIFSIHAGQGGTEACDWAQMLLRMYMRFFDKQDWKYQITHEVKGNETGINTVTLEISGPYAFGYLNREHGTHRLVRISPFNSQGLRQTSFAGVEVTPLIEEDLEVALNPEDIQFSAVRSSGAGGQHVNKSSTSVRLVHVPTGITVSNSSGRSQHQNRDSAMKMLRAKLFQIEEEKLDKEKSDIKGEHKIAGWGNQIRNYVLQPYKLVKDLRTGVQTDQVEKILDGELDEFVEAEIKL